MKKLIILTLLTATASLAAVSYNRPRTFSTTDGNYLVGATYFVDDTSTPTVASLTLDGETITSWKDTAALDSVSSVFGRNGAVTAQEDDYSAFYYTKEDADALYVPVTGGTTDSLVVSTTLEIGGTAYWPVTGENVGLFVRAPEYSGEYGGSIGFSAPRMYEYKGASIAAEQSGLGDGQVGLAFSTRNDNSTNGILSRQMFLDHNGSLVVSNTVYAVGVNLGGETHTNWSGFGDVFLSSNNTFTGINNFNGPVNVSGGYTENNSVAIGEYSHAEGYEATAGGHTSHAEGYHTTAGAAQTHAEGYYTTASGSMAHAEGSHTIASGAQSHAEGVAAIASGWAAHAENRGTASGNMSHAEGYDTLAQGVASHAEGYGTMARGENAHAEGSYTVADGDYSHASGYKAHADHNYSYVWSGSTEIDSSTAHGQYKVVAPGGIVLRGLPTSEPTTVGQVWNDNGTLKIKQ